MIKKPGASGSSCLPQRKRGRSDQPTEEKMKKFIVAAALIAIASSAQAFENHQPVIIASAANVGQCQLVGTFRGPTGYRMMGSPSVAAGFEGGAMQMAAEKGATHMVWAYEDSGLERTVLGKAYKCGGTEAIAMY